MKEEQEEGEDKRNSRNNRAKKAPTDQQQGEVHKTVQNVIKLIICVIFFIVP